MNSLLQVTVGVGDMTVSNDPNEVLVTFALGSCLGVTAWDKKARVGGLLHFMLPLSGINPQKATENVAMFGDVAIPHLLERLFELGASRRTLVIKLAGGAQINGIDSFEIGKRNQLLAKRLLWKNSLSPVAEAVGGNVSRTLRLEVGSGRVLVREPSREFEL